MSGVSLNIAGRSFFQAFCARRDLWMIVLDYSRMADERAENLEIFISALPDPEGARAFLARLEGESLTRARSPLVVARLLTIAAYSPYLAESLLGHPEQIGWLEREAETYLDRIKSKEQLSEDLARFTTRMMDADDQTRLARFKRRELLRIYLRDCLHIAALSEITEELSNLADVIVAHVLTLALQEMTNLHGSPQSRDERGRIEAAEFAVVALGKLGCLELNYASDIDLLFLYSGDGRTAQSAISNKEFFIEVAKRVVQMIGSNRGEGVVYRIDLRLRPYGRDGDLVWEVGRAADYYRDKAQNWERQALIRARAVAGSEAVVARFLDEVRASVFAPSTIVDSIAEVRKAKEKIDRALAEQTGGYNVKLGRGGIREIEFIVQALQLQHGGREPWIRSAQTLIVLARLAEKGYLTEPERAHLSIAYTFFRTVEHRLQMEHGAQTHRLPVSRERLALLARRCGYVSADDPAARFMADLEAHVSSVRTTYNRVFEQGRSDSDATAKPERADERDEEQPYDDEATRLVKQAARALVKLTRFESEKAHARYDDKSRAATVEQIVISALPSAINQSRSLKNLSAWAESLATYSRDQVKTSIWSPAESEWPALIRRLVPVLSSQYLSHILVARPALAGVLTGQSFAHDFKGFLQALRSAINEESNPSSKADALRRAWYQAVVDIGSRDMARVAGRGSGIRETMNKDEDVSCSSFNLHTSSDSLRANNLEQTALAEAALRIAVEIALESMGMALAESSRLPFAILALGRLGHAGMDYGSDLDLLFIFDEASLWPLPQLDSIQGEGEPLARLSQQEFYAKLASQTVQVLSSITREGLLYRVDLRLRPDGANGSLAHSLQSLVSYLAKRASAWEHSAYLKAREVAGDLEFGARARSGIIEAAFEAASKNESLKDELHSMRMRLEKEKGRGSRPNIKWGAGGMTDVYFITRYLQLRDRVAYPTEQGTTALVLHLGEQGSLDRESTDALYHGYMFLRRLDHWMRLLLDRPGPALPASHIALAEIAHALGHASIEGFERALTQHTVAIRRVYNQTFAV